MEGERLDIALAQMLPEFSRSKITAWIKSGQALISDNKFKQKDKVSGNETVELVINQNQNNKWLAEDIPIYIVFEDVGVLSSSTEYWNGRIYRRIGFSFPWDLFGGQRIPRC